MLYGFQKRITAAFSLLEVVLAVGVLSLAVVALIGIVGPLLRGLADDQMSGELEAILASIRQATTEAAKADYDGFRSQLRSVTERYVFRLESGVIGEAGWVVEEAAAFTAELSNASADRFIRGPIAGLLELSSESQVAESYEPFIISIWIAGVPDPTASLTEWSTGLRARAPDYTVRYVIHR